MMDLVEQCGELLPVVADRQAGVVADGDRCQGIVLLERLEQSRRVLRAVPASLRLREAVHEDDGPRRGRLIGSSEVPVERHRYTVAVSDAHLGAEAGRPVPESIAPDAGDERRSGVSDR